MSEGRHSYSCYGLICDDDLIAEVAAVVRELYVDDLALRVELRNAAQDLDSVCDEAEIQRILDQVAAAVIPQMDADSAVPVHLQVPRNEVAEVLALHVLENVHRFQVPASRIRNKEVAGQPSRGLDVLGLTASSAVVLTEVKASSSAASPPAVVHAASDSMQSETLRRLNDSESLLAELAWALKHAKPELKASVAQSLLLYAQPGAPIPVVAPVLVRPTGGYKPSDYGNFRTPSASFGQSEIRFVVVQLSSTLEEFAASVYSKAAEQTA